MDLVGVPLASLHSFCHARISLSIAHPELRHGLTLNAAAAPRVTVGIPTLNRRRYLEQTLASVLAQTHVSLEVVISNNASSDDTAAFLAAVSDPRVRVLTQDATLAMQENWNACLQAATGTYFLLVSDDDLLEPDAVASLLQAIERAPDPERVGMVYSRQTFIDQDGCFVLLSQTAPECEDPFSLTLGMFGGLRNIALCSTMMRTAEMLPGYSPQFHAVMDHAMWMRVTMGRGQVRFVNRPIVKYRIHQNASAETPSAVLQQDLLKLGEYAAGILRLDRRRDAAYIEALSMAVVGAMRRVPQDRASIAAVQSPTAAAL